MFMRPTMPRRTSSSSSGTPSDPDTDDTGGFSGSNTVGPSSPLLGRSKGPEGAAAKPSPGEQTGDGASATGSVPGAASARFRASVQRLMRLRHLAATSGPGSEPGVDINRDAQEYDHIVADCVIDVIDYGKADVKMRRFDNGGFLNFLDSSLRSREDWAKVRWINIKGIDWKVIKALSLVYKMHPLAIEDVIHARDMRSKVDYYKDQLYIQALSLMLRTPEDPESEVVSLSSEETAAELSEPIKGRTHPWLKTTAPTSPGETDTARRYGATEDASRPYRAATLMLDPRRQKIYATRVAVEKLRGEERVQVKGRNLSMFLFRDGTLITFHDGLDSIYDQAIKTRLQEENTLLRGTADASILLQSLLDLIVDHAIEVVDAFQAQILELEQQTLLRPEMDSVKLLHVLSAEITLHKRSLKPLQSLVYGLRRYDLDRAVALAVSADPNANASNTQGFMSHQAKVYLADVHDHLEYVIASMEMYQTITENLIGYSFNILSYDMNETMRRLTLATIIFFPLTFLTSYFGMNFTDMPSINGSEWYFWQMSIPCMIALVLFFTWGDFMKAWKYVKGRSLSARIQKSQRSQYRSLLHKDL